MDIQLPGMSGIEAFKELRADPTTRAIPIIAVTASVMAPGPPEDHGGWLRWLPGEAHQCPRAAGDDAMDPGEVMTISPSSVSNAYRISCCVILA